jgi:prepilin-type N-terminal cleavage/methylation domain-containing protein
MQKRTTAIKGFTIIELLVVIVVIGILASIMVVSYTGIQQRSRDSERDSHIIQIKLALEKYYAGNGMYPAVCANDNVGCAASMLATPLAPYLATIPNDPRYAAGSANDYRYVRAAVVDNNYSLLVSYESKNKCKTGPTFVENWWGAAIPRC